MSRDVLKLLLGLEIARSPHPFTEEANPAFKEAGRDYVEKLYRELAATIAERQNF
jgi:hypothetical protein